MDRSGSPLTVARMTVRNLYRRPMRTSLTALGVAVGVVAIVAFGTITQGMWDSVDSAIRFDDADMLVFQANVAADILSVLDEQETQAKLAAIPEIERTVPMLWYVLPIEDQDFCLVYGVRLKDTDPEWEHLVEGRNPETDDEIEIGSIAARMFDKEVGDTLEIRGQPYRIVGRFHTNIVFFNSAIVISLPRLQQLTGLEGKATVFEVHLRPGSNTAEVVERIERENPDLVAVTEASEYKKVDKGLEIMRDMVQAVSVISLIIGSIIIANTMWMTVLERTREIGVLRAVGWSRRHIVLMILLEAAGVGVFACAIGSALGVGLAELSTVMPGSEQFLDPVYDATPFLLALGTAVSLSVLGALIPAWRAARISPAEALRYE